MQSLKSLTKKKTMKSISQLIKDKKEQWSEKEFERVKSDFKVTERGGILFLTFNGVAFAEMKGNATAAAIAEALNLARETASKFEKL